MGGIKEAVKRYYAEAARAATAGQEGCCDGCGDAPLVALTSYTDAERAALPGDAVSASMGCGNPTALAELRPGEVVLDLGSGGGIDVLLSAKRVGPTGKVYGLDMTDEMLELARANQREAGIQNVEFLKGEIEAIPLPDNTVDVIISNCVINLSADKRRVFNEAYHVLKPGGRLAVSDIVATRPVEPAVRENLALWSGCVAGALDRQEYRDLLEEAGFEDVALEPAHQFTVPGAGEFMSAFVRARKPA